MPQIQAADDAAHDEPKTYNDEKGLENWEQDARLELENVKGDLVQQGDPEPQDQSYDNKPSSSHGDGGGGGQRRKSDSERDSVGGAVNGRCAALPHGLAYSTTAEFNSLLPGLQNSFLQPVMPSVSAQVGYPYPPYHQHIPAHLLYGATTAAAADLDMKAAGMAARAGDPSAAAMYSLPGQLGQIPHPLSQWTPATFPYCTAASIAGMLRPHPFALTSAAATGISHFSMLTPQGGAMHPSMLSHPAAAAAGLQLPGQLGGGGAGGAGSNGHGGGQSAGPSSKPNSNENKSLPILENSSSGGGGGGGGGNGSSASSAASAAMHHPHTTNHLLHHHTANHAGGNGSSKRESKSKEEKSNRPYVKKPLNAFMLYMKEQRSKVVAECTLKESAAINQILGRKWHNLNREEQQKYYDMARKERQLHMEKFPGWSARDNYGKRKKRKKEKTQDCTAQNPKKCRAVFGLDHQAMWCPPCRRKKKCVRYRTDGDDSDCDDSDGSPIGMNYQGSSPGLMPQAGGGGMFDAPPSLQHMSTNGGGGNSGGPSPLTAAPHHSPPSNNNNQQQQQIRMEHHHQHIKRELSPPTHNKNNNNEDNPQSALAAIDNGMFHSNGSHNSNGNNNNNNSFGASTSQQQSSPTTSMRRDDSSTPTNKSGFPNPTNPHHQQSLPRLQQQKDLPSSSAINRSGAASATSSRRSTATGGGGGENSPQAPQTSNSFPNMSTSGAAAANLFNASMLSPNGLGTTHAGVAGSPFAGFPAFPPYLQMNSFAAAASAGLQSSPALSGLMGFSGFKGLASPMGLGLNATNSPSATGNMPGSATSNRLTSSALEGKS